MSTRAESIVAQMKALADPVRAVRTRGYFKAGPAGNVEGDVFLGVTTPQLRGVLRAHPDLTLEECIELLDSEWHEVRLLAVLGMARLAKKATPDERLRIRRAYLAHTDRINNWDLVDSSAGEAVGLSVLERDELDVLEKLAQSESLWERRIAIVATFAHLRAGAVEPTLRIAQLLLGDRHDLIHKATGWLLREVGKRDEAAVERFLDRHAATMPRTALRYAIEKMPPDVRRAWLNRKARSRT